VATDVNAPQNELNLQYSIQVSGNMSPDSGRIFSQNSGISGCSCFLSRVVRLHNRNVLDVVGLCVWCEGTFRLRHVSVLCTTSSQTAATSVHSKPTLTSNITYRGWYSVASGKRWNNTLKLATTDSFHILPNSPLRIILPFNSVQPMQ